MFNDSGNFTTRATTDVSGTGSTSEYDDNYEEYSRSVSVLVFLIGAVGFLANGFVLVVISRTPRLRKHSGNIFICHQTCVDFLSSLMLITCYGIALKRDGKLAGTSGEILCRLFIAETLFWATFTASTFNLINITIDRYVLIVFTLKHKLWFSGRRVYVMFAATWVAAILFNAPMTFTSGVDGVWCTYDNYPNPRMQHAYDYGLTATTYFAPLVFYIYAYGHMVYVLYKRKTFITRNTLTSAPPTKKTHVSRAQINMTKTMVITCSAFILSCGPHYVYSMCYETTPHAWDDPVYYPTLLLATSNCLMNPFIYSITLNTFKNAAKDLFCKPPKGDAFTTTTTINRHVPEVLQTMRVELPVSDNPLTRTTQLWSRIKGHRKHIFTHCQQVSMRKSTGIGYTSPDMLSIAPEVHYSNVPCQYHHRTVRSRW